MDSKKAAEGAGEKAQGFEDSALRYTGAEAVC